MRLPESGSARKHLALAKLNHPNIATIFEFSSQNSTDYLVTEYIAGQTLDEKLAISALPETEVISQGVRRVRAKRSSRFSGNGLGKRSAHYLVG
jgi:serine/threonine protein kinase